MVEQNLGAKWVKWFGSKAFRGERGQVCECVRACVCLHVVGIVVFCCCYLLLLFLDRVYTSWLVWNFLCRPSWPRIHREPPGYWATTSGQVLFYFTRFSMWHRLALNSLYIPVGLELSIVLLPYPPKGWDCRSIPPPCLFGFCFETRS